MSGCYFFSWAWRIGVHHSLGLVFVSDGGPWMPQLRDTLYFLDSWIGHKPVVSEKALSLAGFGDTERDREHRR